MSTSVGSSLEFRVGSDRNSHNDFRRTQFGTIWAEHFRQGQSLNYRSCYRPGVAAMNAGVIAVIDDNETWIESVTEVLTDAGFEVHSATNGEQAIDLLDSIRPNLIILDVHIPGTSGLRILSDYRGHDRATPILVVSADDRAQIRDRAMSDGATSFLKKPIPSQILIRAVKRFVLHPTRDTSLQGGSVQNGQTDAT